MHFCRITLDTRGETNRGSLCLLFTVCSVHPQKISIRQACVACLGEENIASLSVHSFWKDVKIICSTSSELLNVAAAAEYVTHRWIAHEKDISAVTHLVKSAHVKVRVGSAKIETTFFL